MSMNTEHQVKLDTVYRHFKGHLVFPFKTAICAETGETVIVYVCLSDNRTYTRKANDWFTDVTKREDNTTGNKLRFEEYKTVVSALD